MEIQASQGAYTGYFRFGADILDRSSYIQATGKAPAIAHIFHDWIEGPLDAANPPYRTFSSPIEMGQHSLLDVAATLAAQGTVLSVAWDFATADPYDPGYYYGDKAVTVTVDSVINGAHDAYIRTVAQEIRQLGVPIMLSPFGEVDQKAAFAFGANGTTYMEMVEDTSGQYGDPSIPDGPERMRDMYRHVVDIFNQEGVDNVTWYMYTSSEFMNTAPELGVRTDLLRPEYLYPGDNYVDWIGQSAYFIDPQNPPNLNNTDPLTGLPTDTFFGLVDTLSPGYNAWTAITDKPFFIPEFGMIGDGTQDRAAMITEAFNTLLPQFFPNVKAVTIVDSQIAADYFFTPQLGATQAEINALGQAIGANAYYVSEVGTEQIPAPPPADPYAGDDNLTGTADHDYIASSTGNDIVDGKNGSDTIDGGAGDDDLYGSGGDDVLLGMLGGDYLNGGRGHDTLEGGGNDDTLIGETGEDYLDGGAGNDYLDAGTSNDILIGGDGYDTLYGRGGEDIFVFTSGQASSYDTVKDFNKNYDMLYLGDVLEGTEYNAAEGDAISNFLSSVVYNNSTYLAVDTDGAGGADKVYFAVLENVKGLGSIQTMIANGQVILEW